MRKKIFHLFPSEKFTDSFVEFVNKNYENEGHHFIVLGDFVGDCAGCSNVTIVKSAWSEKFYRPLLFVYLFFKLVFVRRILLHSLNVSYITTFLSFFSILLPKVIWVPWGADIYCVDSDDYDLNSVREQRRRKVISSVPFVAALTSGDYEELGKRYSLKAEKLRAIYLNPVTMSDLDKVEERVEEETKTIQIGNSASPENNHFEMIDLLLKFKSEKIRVIAPLAYGGKGHANKVVSYGKSLLGDKFEAITEFVDPKEYGNTLNAVDIMVFNHHRQQGLGNIYAMAYLNKKIFLRSDVSSWGYLSKELGFDVYCTTSIDSMSFEEFVTPMVKNKKQAMNTVYNESYIKEIWDVVFEK